MKRITLLCVASAREETLKRLQELGVVHVTNLRPPDSRALETARTHLAYIKRTLETMPARTEAKPSGLPADVTVSLVWTLLQDKKDIEDALAELRQERVRIQPFGNFDPGMIVGLRSHGVHVKLYTASPEAKFDVPDGAAVETIREDKECVYLALFARDDLSLSLPEFRLPDRSLAQLDEQIAEYERRLAECEASLKVHEGDHRPVAELRDQLEDSVHFLEARDGMGMAAPVSYLRGYLPAEQESTLLAEGRAQGWGVQIDEPGPDEEVPTLIRNPAWIRPVEAVLKAINVLPGYREVDMSSLFLLFFSLFFAMLVGDAGYGAIFLGLTVFFRFKFRAAPSEPFALLAITSVATIIWGVLTGTYFGAPLLPAAFPPLNDDYNIKSLCFLIGAVHLTLAHGWNVVRLAPNPGVLAQIGWIAMTWTMYFVAHLLVLDQAMPAFVPWMAIGGAVLILLFMTPPAKFKEEWFNHVMFPLNVVSNFVDVVSYIRLFAVGFASFAVAQAFNEMAMSAGFSGILSGIGAALILFAGHALNIVLGAMGILVHGVRLNTLEFSSHLGVQWTGHAYAPFSRKRTGSSR